MPRPGGKRDGRSTHAAHATHEVEVRAEKVVGDIRRAAQRPKRSPGAHHACLEVDREILSRGRQGSEIDRVQAGEQLRQRAPGRTLAALERPEVAGGEPAVGATDELGDRHLVLLSCRAERPSEPRRPAVRVELHPGRDLDGISFHAFTIDARMSDVVPQKG